MKVGKITSIDYKSEYCKGESNWRLGKARCIDRLYQDIVRVSLNGRLGKAIYIDSIRIMYG